MKSKLDEASTHDSGISRRRCGWVDLSKPDYVAYHDTEWGVPQFDDRVLFEFMLLESAQAGLSWYTILQKRQGYRQAFAGFDVQQVAAFDEQRVAALLHDAVIVRNQAKIRAAIHNAQCFLRVQAEYGSFSHYLWGFVGHRPKINHWPTLAACPTQSAESEALSKDLKRRGFKFMGSTVCYAYMQAVGLVNDHVIDCFRHAEVSRQSVGCALSWAKKSSARTRLAARSTTGRG